jgi:hypothetical protein
MALGSTQPQTEMSTRNLPGRGGGGGKGRPARKADNLTAICWPTVYKMWEPLGLTCLWGLHDLLQGYLYLFFSMAPQPLWALAALFQFPNLYTGGRTP